MSLADDVNLDEFVMTKDDLSGADIKAICTESGLLVSDDQNLCLATRCADTNGLAGASREKDEDHAGSFISWPLLDVLMMLKEVLSILILHFSGGLPQGKGKGDAQEERGRSGRAVPLRCSRNGASMSTISGCLSSLSKRIQ